jgi:autotransporter-associated beta strand protein
MRTKKISTIIPMKPKYQSASSLRTAIFAIPSYILLASTASQAADYNYGTATENFSISATDQARRQGGGTASDLAFGDNGWGAVYDRGGDRDVTYMHFNLSSLAGGTINGTVNLSWTIDATHGGIINGGIVGSATNAWSYPGNTGGITTIIGADPSGSYSSGQTATAVIDNSTFQGFATDLSTFHGLAITAGAGSSAHFSGPAVLTGNATTGLITVGGGTDWSAAAWNSGTSTLSISGSSDVSGGSITMRTGGTISVTDSATLSAGSFSGGITNAGALAFGSSSNQTLSGVISGSGSLAKSGTGTLTLSAANSYSGGTTISAGILQAGSNSALGSNGSAIIVNSGATLDINGSALQGYTQNIQIAGAGADSSIGALVNTGGDNLNAIRGITLTGNTSIGGNGGRWDIGRLDFNSDPNNTVDHIDGGGFVLTKVGSNTVGLLTGATNLAGFILDGGMITPHENTSLGTAPITINAGIFNTWAGLTLANNFTLNGGTIQQVDNFNDNYTGAFTVNSAVEFYANNGSITLSGPVSGVGALNKTGGGTLRLSGDNSHTGSLTINGGHVRFGSSTNYAIRGNVELINPGSFLVMEQPNQFGPNVDLLFNSSGAHNEFALYGNNQTIASLASANQYAVVQNSHGGFGAASASSTLTVNQSIDTTYSGIIRNNTGNDAYSLALIKSGSGTLTLAANTAHTGGTTVDGGVLEVAGSNYGNGNLRGTVTVNTDGELRYTGGDGTGFGYNNGNKIDTLTINGGLVDAQHVSHVWNATVNMTGGELRVNGGVSDPAGLHFEWGNSSVNTFASADTATISGRIRIRPDSSPNVTFTVADGSAATDLLVSAAITQTGISSVTKAGPGTMKLTGENRYSGRTIVQEGTLILEQASLNDTADVELETADTTMQLDFVGTDIIDELLIDGLLMPSGTWGRIGHPTAQHTSSQITGDGLLYVAYGTYTGWASRNGATSQTPEQDHDNDGVPNGIEYFMGQTGSSFTSMPGLDATNTVTWAMDPTYNGTWQVQTSADLSTWTNVSGTDNGNSVSYTLPTGLEKQFLRLLATPTP